jgi:hypothetical protein
MNIGWMAGMYEGEGCIEQTSAHSYRLAIVSTDLDVIEKIQSFAGGYVHPEKVYKLHHKPAWRWRLGKKNEVANLLEQMLPFLGNRRSNDAIKALNNMEKSNAPKEGIV